MLEYYRFKEAYDLLLKGKIQEVRHILTELQSRYIEVCDENSLLKMQIQEFEDAFYLEKNLMYDGAYYWLKTGNIRQGPFCKNCYDTKGLLMRLNEDDSGWRCYTCGGMYALKRGADVRSTLAKSESQKVIPLYK